MSRKDLITALVIITGSFSANARAELIVEHGWLRPAPLPNLPAAAYVTVINDADSPVEITSIHSPIFARVEWHRTNTENGVAKMRKVDPIVLEPRQQITMMPGAHHLMLFDPAATLQRGQQVRLIFEHGNGASFEAMVTIEQPDPAHHHHH